MGNPNVGKSVVFSRLTGVNVIASNYPGTTVSYTKGSMVLDGEKVEVIDVPGTYSLEPTCKAESVACEILKEGDLIINVIDATNLERNLHLTFDLIQTGKPLIIVLNMWDDAKHKGIEIDAKKLEEIINVPVIPTVAVTGEGINTLVDRLKEAKPIEREFITESQRWDEIGRIIRECQSLSHRHHTFLERLEDASIVPTIGIPIAFFVMFISFKIIRFIGEFLGGIVENFFDIYWTPLIMRLSELLSTKGLLHDVVIGKLIEGKIDYEQSFGLLTTGLFVEFAIVLPYIVSFYLVLGILEDTGYLPRFAVLIDTLIHKVGLHGYASISMFLGCGCNIPGILATRILETRRERFIAATLMSIAVPCMSETAMVIGILGKKGGKFVLIVYSTLFVVWVILGLILNKILKGESQELFVEIPPYRLPYFGVIAKKFYMRIKEFVLSALPVVWLGVLIANLLYLTGIIELLGKVTAPVIVSILGLPKEAVSAILLGFLRKDIAVGMLSPLNLTSGQLVVASVVISMFFPCIATFAILLRELGVKDMLKSTLIMIITSILVGGILNIFV